MRSNACRIFWISAAPLLHLSAAFAQAESAPAPGAQSIERVEVRELRDPALMPYKDAYEMLSKFQQSGKYPLVDLKISVASSNKAITPASIKLTLVGDTLNIPIPLAADGRVQVPLLPEALRDNAEIVSNQPKKSLSAHIEFIHRLPPGQRYVYRDVMAALPQAQSALREFVPWYLRWLAPSFGAAEFRFAEGVKATATLQNENGTVAEKIQADERGRIRIRMQKDWLAGDMQIVLSDPPLEITPAVGTEAPKRSNDSTGG